MTKVFISYSWDNDDHKNWVRNLATRLRSDGIDVTLDQWHLIPGDQLPEFMERAVRESDYVLIICTHKYKERSNNRQGGVGYEGDIMTAEVSNTQNQRKFIPILRQQSWTESSPAWLFGKYYIDLSSSPYSKTQYDDLLTTLLGTRTMPPPIGDENGNSPTISEESTPSIKLAVARAFLNAFYAKDPNIYFDDETMNKDFLAEAKEFVKSSNVFTSEEDLLLHLKAAAESFIYG